MDNGDSYIGIPPIIEVTIYMLDSILKNNGKYQIFVFPEKDQSYFLFALAFLLNNIITGNISTEYDPHKKCPDCNNEMEATFYLEIEGNIISPKIICKECKSRLKLGWMGLWD